MTTKNTAAGKPCADGDSLAPDVLLDTTFTTIPDGLAAFDRHHRLTRWNDAYFELMGYPQHLAVRGTPFRHFIAFNAYNGEYGANDPEVEIDFRMQADQLGKVRDNIWPRNNGRMVRLRRVPVDGGGLFCVATDVTETKRQELQLRQSELRLKLLSESVDEGLLVHDGQCVVDANSAATRMLGRAVDGLDGRRLETLFTSASWPRVLGVLDGGADGRARVEGISITGEHLPLEILDRRVPPAFLQVYEPMLLRVGGELVRLVDLPEDTSATPALSPTTAHMLLPDGRIEVLSPAQRDAEMARRATRMLVIRDLSRVVSSERERAQVAERMRQSHKLEALGTLAGGIAHDFNNILSAVLGYAYLVADQDRDATLARYGQRIVSAGHRARDLVSQMLTYSRRTVPERQAVALDELVVEARDLLRASLPASIEIDYRAPAALPRVDADPSQVLQVMMNLGTNAAQAMPDGGRLEIDLCVEHVQASTEATTASGESLDAGPYVMLTVRDSGAGIEPTVRERIFDPFFTTKAAGGGTGLGLSIVHGIVASHDGAIRVESKPGRGTAVGVLLPCSPGSDAFAAGSSESTALPGTGQHILVVDDEASLLDVTGELLTGFGYTCTTSGSGRDALDLIDGGSDDFALVLTDLTMPGMSGLELAVAVRARAPRLPVLLMTGFGDQDIADKAQATGVLDVLHKPVAPEALARAVSFALAR